MATFAEMGMDPRLDARGAQYIPYPAQPGETFWKLVDARWYDVEESGGNSTIFVEVLDESGGRVTGQMVERRDGGMHAKPSESKPGSDYAVDFPMFNAGWPYSVEVAGASDAVSRLGMGTIAEPMVGYHTAYRLVFRRTVAGSEPPAEPPEPPQPTEGLEQHLDEIFRHAQEIERWVIAARDRFVPRG